MTVGESVARVLLEAVAEKTGYPIDMLELDMRLDTDLGIDSIKRVEILSAVQERLPQAGSISPSNWGRWRRFGRLSRHCPDSSLPASPRRTKTASQRDHNTNGTAHHIGMSDAGRHGARTERRPLRASASGVASRDSKPAMPARDHVRLRAGDGLGHVGRLTVDRSRLCGH